MFAGRSVSRLALLVLALGCIEVPAGTLYKLVDKNGKVTYSESVPQYFDGDVIPLQIDSNTNSVPSPPVATDGGARAETEAEKIIRRRPPNNDAQIEAARLKAKAARKAFEDARDNSTPDDWVYVGIGNPLGMRRFPKPEYEARLAELEKQATLAEEELDKLERGR